MCFWSRPAAGGCFIIISHSLPLFSLFISCSSSPPHPLTCFPLPASKAGGRGRRDGAARGGREAPGGEKHAAGDHRGPEADGGAGGDARRAGHKGE